MGMPATAKRWTADDVRALPADRNRYEVIEGELYVTPAPSFRHQEALSSLHFAMSLYLREHPVGMVLFAPTDVEFEPESMVQPDLFVLPLVDGRKPRSVKEAGKLLLAVEVLSPSTARLDRQLKRRLYQRYGVEEYWIVDLTRELWNGGCNAKSGPRSLRTSFAGIQQRRFSLSSYRCLGFSRSRSRSTEHFSTAQFLASSTAIPCLPAYWMILASLVTSVHP
ncbi:MAG: Uma2 family endonuclease [Gemmatimonadaceae bacterium]|nr:Uma2 family endonuclease [Gemmatimonadaceae bacterium]